MNYRHTFHAGNFADVHKHLLLSLLWREMQQKDTGLCYIDTHAGAGGYYLDTQDSLRGAETASGIERVWAAASPPAEVSFWLKQIGSLPENAKAGRSRFYPGSPKLAQSLKRPQDRLVLAETQASQRDKLQHSLPPGKGIQILNVDGFSLLKSQLPPPEKRALVLMDPPYEHEQEYARLIQALQTGYQRWPQTVMAIWYPIKDETFNRKWRRQLEESGVRNLLVTEIRLRSQSLDNKLKGSGMALVNCPWQLPARLPALLDWLSQTLSDQGSYQVQQLVGE